jgi:hypothetical protein
VLPAAVPTEPASTAAGGPDQDLSDHLDDLPDDSALPDLAASETEHDSEEDEEDEEASAGTGELETPGVTPGESPTPMDIDDDEEPLQPIVRKAPSTPTTASVAQSRPRRNPGRRL